MLRLPLPVLIATISLCVISTCIFTCYFFKKPKLKKSQPQSERALPPVSSCCGDGRMDTAGLQRKRSGVSAIIKQLIPPTRCPPVAIKPGCCGQTPRVVKPAAARCHVGGAGEQVLRQTKSPTSKIISPANKQIGAAREKSQPVLFLGQAAKKKKRTERKAAD